MDFYHIAVKEDEKKGTIEIFPDFRVGRSKDLMVRGRAFYAIWDEAAGLWSTDEYDVQRLVDADIRAEKERMESKGSVVTAKFLSSFGNNGWAQFRRFVQNVSDSATQLDENLTFANTEVKKSDHVSRRLPYPLAKGNYSAWDELVGTLYSVEERAKIEWAIGSVVAGDAKKIQKFLVFYGAPGSGKGTILNIVEKLFAGYTTTFDAKALGSSNSQFATDSFRDNPLVAIQQDGDLSRIEDNTRLNSIISHEYITMNEKFKSSYSARVNAMLFLGTNQPVKISDAKSGIIRRLIDVHPTGVRISPGHYEVLVSQVDFELGAIAEHCLSVYQQMGKNYYNSYRPMEMMLQTDVFFNFIEANYETFKFQEYTTLRQAYLLYKEFCSDTGVEKMLPQYKVREELRNYFDEFKDRHNDDGEIHRSVYLGFNANKFKTPVKDEPVFSLVIEETESLLDDYLVDQPAQGASEAGIPRNPWALVKSTLDHVDTAKLHFVKVPTQHIVIDFDLKDETGNKSLERNLQAASEWPPTYAELSKSGAGVHLHYTYVGDVGLLSGSYAEGIEVKTLLGDSSLRRKLTKCNNIPVAKLTGGLPLKEKKMITEEQIKSEKGLRDLIERNLRKEIHPDTTSSVSFILKILEDARDSGMNYDVTDMRSQITAFANNSSNQAMMCLKMVMKMPFAGGEGAPIVEETLLNMKDDRLVFFDLEVYPNLVVICWKYEDADEVVRMVNPTAQEVEKLFAMRLVGFNNRRYDNHILWALYMGYDVAGAYRVSSKLIGKTTAATFGEAYSASYADIYDFTTKKQSLKKYQIELGIPHMEMDLSWDEPVPDDLIDKVVEYCVNDVKATESVFKSRAGDWTARQILAELSGLSTNEPTAKHAARIIFGPNRNPQKEFIYTDLSKDFPGYQFERGKSTYEGEEPGEGGYVYAEPGMYENVYLLDIASMHPASLIAMNYFGEYTPRFTAIRDARLAIKHGDYATAREMLDGKLKPYLKDESQAKDLSYALKIVINTVYGLTSAKFENPFKHPKNLDNIIAKRGALFMIDLKNELQNRGETVVHIKTDSIKLVDPSKETIQFVQDYGQKWGYDFELEAVYDKFCLVNDAVYIARDVAEWHPTGKQFAHPYVFKTLFSGEEVTFDDLVEIKEVNKGSMYLDFDAVNKPMALTDGDMRFIGRFGSFVPVVEGQGGGLLYKVQDDKFFAVSGTKGYYWMESNMARSKEDLEIDMGYFESLVDDAIKNICKFGELKEFLA